jgi:succinylglutamic semialdehyde dehydrogenase
MQQLFVDGNWARGEGPQLRSIDPATGSEAWTGKEATKVQVDRAFAAARRAFAGWSAAPFDHRVERIRRFGALVEAHREQLARVISLETGKPTWESLDEVASMVAKVDISIRAHQERTGAVERDLGRFRSVVRHRGHGVLAVLGPYNFPGHLPNGHIVPALLAGNTVVFKPSEHTPRCAVEIFKLWEITGLPSGTINLVQGGKSTGAAMLENPEVDGVLFTGSAAAGHAIHRHFAGRPQTILALEMGGNNPLVVGSLGNVDAAVYTILHSAYVTAGQRCTCARRLFVPRGPRGERVIERLVHATGKLRIGSFEERDQPFMGPVISEEAAEALLAAQSRIVSLGGEPLIPMRKLREGTGFVSPGLIDVTRVRDLPDEEHFGPLLQLIRYDDFDQALEDANATQFGLAAGLIGEDRAQWDVFLRRIRAGVVNWNRPLTGASSAAPFGGIGASGNHRPSAYYAADYCAYPIASLEEEALRLPETLPPGMVL